MLRYLFAQVATIEVAREDFGDPTDTKPFTRICGDPRLRSGSSGFSDQCFYQLDHLFVVHPRIELGLTTRIFSPALYQLS